MKLVVASDTKNHVTDAVIDDLKRRDHQLTLVGDLVAKNGKWAEIAKEAAKKVSSSEVGQGIFFCWSGTGICMAANKIPGARAALCWDAETARLARKWNDANILCMSLRFISETVAKEILEAWFTTNYNEEHLDEVRKIG
ncbi:MAG: RpiB/LacA/LacB family sugar-phosphate isomerase [Deltaproteobacteria bacterium]|nr:RpiB/LacA/LacB family sugar-phosphate isomerase [Deltaproteobacteria bacterium]